MLGQGVEGAFDLGLVRQAAHRPQLEPAQEGMAEVVGGEEAVQVAAEHPAVLRDRALRPAV